MVSGKCRIKDPVTGVRGGAQGREEGPLVQWREAGRRVIGKERNRLRESEGDRMKEGSQIIWLLLGSFESSSLVV